MRKYTVTRTSGDMENVDAETCTPTANGDLVFFVLSAEGKPVLSRAFANATWNEVEYQSEAIVM